MPRSDDRGRWWRDVATLVALAGLLGTMVFNTIGVRHTATESRKQAEQARLSRQDGQIALMTSLSTFLQDTDLALEQTRAGEKVCDPTIRLTRRERFAICLLYTSPSPRDS